MLIAFAAAASSLDGDGVSCCVTSDSAIKPALLSHYAVTYQPQQSVCIEDKVGFVGLNIPDDCVHASGLVVAWHHL